MTRTKNVAIAAAVAGLFALGAGHAFAAEGDTMGDKVKCEGVNSCKGHGGCSTDKHSCKSSNSCKSNNACKS